MDSLRSAGRAGGRLLRTAGLLLVSALVFLALAPGLAVAEEAASPAPEPVAPDLEIEWSWPTAIITFGLVIFFYIMVFWMSEREFKGVIAERFGPKSRK